MPRKDPIIEEIHAVREELARQADYDLERMIEAARERQAASGLKAVRLPPRRAEPAKKARGKQPETQVIGYVGTTGNAGPNNQHLYFAIFRLNEQKNWWQGEAINPYPILRPGP